MVLASDGTFDFNGNVDLNNGLDVTSGHVVLSEGVEFKMGTASNLEIISISGNKARIQSQQEHLEICTGAVKEIKFRPNTDIHDYEVKMRSVTKFLDHGDKVKITMRFRGREMAHQELGKDLLERVAEDTAEIGKIDSIPKMEGRQMTMIISPLK